MKGLITRLFIAIALLLWAWDMIFPWQKIVHSEANHYIQIQQNKMLKVGMINHPLSYFIGNEGANGIEYDLANAFAQYLGVHLEIKPYESSEQLFDALKNNDIDIAAAGLLYHPELHEKFQLGPSYYSASWQVAYKKGTARPYRLSDLQKDIIIPAGSAVIPILNQLKQENPDLNWQISDKHTQEELLLKVAQGEIPHTIAMSVDISSAQHISPNLAVGFDLTDESPVLWYLANSSYSELQSSLLDFMSYSVENGLISRIEEKYFNHLAKFDYVDIQSYLKAIKTTLPKYAPLFQAHKGDLDWQMLAAIAYQESHWDPNATSPTGVRGMMMLTKDTAARMKITDRTNPAQSIKAGSEYLHMLMRQMPETIPQADKIWYSLAAYNMGLGHLLDLRRLTRQLGGDPDNWLDVKKNLPLLAEKRYYTNLKYGYARGYEALQYVENIRRYYNSIINYQRVEEQKTLENSLNEKMKQEGASNEKTEEKEISSDKEITTN
ncbi:membrane-bound lytic murein transglycosylase MltF [Mannheimia sp. AT1]|uniref:Membrane-bound lytic murein transglycosylase F n=1 Tax=Mannheimia cairinae TaxID=3025936 RepID=A0ABT5MPE7_9PAST|nr:membrane-bound lytic murein transglycosylase MltF [Mannheimia cairinae]MDD0823858.1 membrane-bound lytic murein transglycosylase MltF [Mannheimia cairinae]MDD0825174.1 membrane-bound lytic murein transglycosylase MltF [Mannheimia cairinae]